ncbi:Free fatty acid receptor 2 [Dissostichus eleginoides]|uniref:Free fatty acid receptor 2 n=1 Tax=Dissostichus eleginoides TaxID=100907 RepID=A0AAD9FEY1_DISEL|nr:Free fatty acid receptor 2 [Dissostichus eleginoides]
MQRCHTALCLSVYIITFVLGFPANLLALYTFSMKVRKKSTPIDILLLNLTISDLLFLLFLPFKMQEVMNNMLWDMPYLLCPLSGFVFYMTIYNSTFFLTAVSVERYLGVAFPIQHTLKRRPVYAVVASIFFWIFSFLNLSIVFCYINFIRILTKLQHIDRRRRLRAIGMALGTLLVFALCFGPYNVSHIVGYITWRSPDWRDKALLCCTFNACLDPLIFYFASSAVRKNVGSLMAGVRSRLNRCMSCHMLRALCGGINETAKDKEHKQEEINAI